MDKGASEICLEPTIPYEPLTEQDKSDLELVHAVRCGQIKKHVEHGFTIVNGQFYREHGLYPWEKKEARLIPRETILRTWGHGWIEDWNIGDEEDPEEIELLECVWIRGEIVTAGGRKRSAESDYWIQHYNRPYGVRMWEGDEKPTEEQRQEEAWRG